MTAPRTLLDLEEKYEMRALVLRTIGGILFIEAFIVCQWIWMGLRAGSSLWFWVTVVLGILGLIGLKKDDRTGRYSNTNAPHNR